MEIDAMPLQLDPSIHPLLRPADRSNHFTDFSVVDRNQS